MKHLTIRLGFMILALAAIGCSAALAFQGKEGWGWFLFVAVICSGCVRFDE